MKRVNITISSDVFAYAKLSNRIYTKNKFSTLKFCKKGLREFHASTSNIANNTIRN